MSRDDLGELAPDVGNLAKHPIIQEVALAESLPVAGLLEPAQQLQEAREVAEPVVEGLVSAARLLLFPQRIQERRRRRQERRAGDGFIDDRRVAVDGLDDHAREPRQNGKQHHLFADSGQAAAVIQCAEPAQRVHGGADVPPARGRDEVEALEVVDTQIGHAQHDLGQVGPQDFLFRERRAVVERSPVVQPVTHAGPCPSRAAGALVAGGAGDRCLGKGSSERTWIVGVELGPPGIDDPDDPVDGQAGLGDVGRCHDLAPPRVVVEHPLLLVAAESGEQRQRRKRPAEPQGAQGLYALADLAFAAQEDQHVARLAGAVDLGDDVADRRLGRSGIVLGMDGPVVDVDGKGARVHPHDGATAEVAREHLGVDGGRGNHHAQVVAPLQHLPEQTQGEVDVEAAFVRLVHDHDLVLAQIAIELDLLQQYAVGHDLDRAGAGRRVLEPHLVGDQVFHNAVRGRHLPLQVPAHRDRGDSPGLGDADARRTSVAVLVQQPGDLRGLAGAGRALHHDRAVLIERSQDAPAVPVDRHVQRRVRHRHHERPRGDRWPAGPEPPAMPAHPACASVTVTG